MIGHLQLNVTHEEEEEEKVLLCMHKLVHVMKCSWSHISHVFCI